MDDKEKQILKINTLEIMMEQNSKDHTEIKEMIRIFGDKLDKSLEKMELRLSSKADKWVETFLRWAAGVAGVVFIGLVIRWLVFLELR
jgi:hypothetical protein